MILGIDIGLTGAIAVLDEIGRAIEVVDMPIMANGKKSAKIKLQINGGELARFIYSTSPDLIFVEEQAAMPKQGVASMFSIGHSFGTVCGVLAALKLPFLTIR